MISEDDPELGQSRLLEAKTHLPMIVTPANVPHSWVVPFSDVKYNVVPSRLNNTSISVQREGVYDLPLKLHKGTYLKLLLYLSYNI
jgi:cytochrome c oxidase subunit 2